MNAILVVRGVLAVVFGLAIGGCVNMALVVLGPHVVPPPPGVNMADPESLAKAIPLLSPQHFVFPFLGHALGTLAGATVGCLVAVVRRPWFSYGIGGFFLLGGISACFMIPAPTWFVVLDLGVAYLPMAWLGARLGLRLRPETAAAPAAA